MMTKEPKIAIVENNTLAVMGLKQLLKTALPRLSQPSASSRQVSQNNFSIISCPCTSCLPTAIISLTRSTDTTPSCSRQATTLTRNSTISTAFAPMSQRSCCSRNYYLSKDKAILTVSTCLN